MTSIYKTILKNAWQILWQAKFLWFFGFFAALLGNGGEFNLLINNFNLVKNQGFVLGTLNSWMQAGGNPGIYFSNIAQNFDWSLGLFLLAFLVILLFIIWLVVVSQSSLVAGIFKFIKKQPVDFRSSFKTGRQKFWPVLSLNLIAKLIIYGLLILIALPLGWSYITSSSGLTQILLILLSFIILIPLAVVTSLWLRYAIIYCVAKDQTIASSIKKAWLMFKKNWLVSVEMVLLLFLVNIIFAIVSLATIAILLIPLFLVGYVLFIFKLQTILSLLIGLGLILLVLLIIWVGALLSTYQHSVWVSLFVRLDEGVIYPKIARFIAWLIVRSKNKKTPVSS